MDADDIVRGAVETDDGNVIIVGDFTTVNAAGRTSLAMVDYDDGSVGSWNVTFDAAIQAVAYSGAVIGFCGDFTAGGGSPASRILRYDTNDGFSPIGRFKCEGLITVDEGDQLQYAKWVIKGPNDGSVFYESLLINEFGTVGDTVVVPGPDVSLPYIFGVHVIELHVTTLAGTTVERIGFGGRTDNYVYVVPDGTETGDPYDEDDTFAAPGISKLGNTYTLTLASGTGSPTSTNDTYFYRIFAVLNTVETILGGEPVGHDNLTIDWAPLRKPWIIQKYRCS